MSIDHDGRFTPADDEVVKRKVRKLIRKFPVLKSDTNDLQQEAAFHVANQHHRFKAERGPRDAFVAVVAERFLLNLIAKATAQKRDRRRERQIKDRDELRVDRSMSPARVGREIDIRDAIDNLPPDLIAIARMLSEFSPSEVEQRTGLTRGQVRARMARIAREFERMNISP